MFGFMKPEAESLGYRSLYSRLCQHQRRHYGLLSLPFHSYEAVFLYTCAVDAGLFPADVILPRRCCRLRHDRRLAGATDEAAGRFCASVAVLLADIKLQDDIRDGWGLLARVARRVLRTPIAATADYFQTLDPEFGRRVGEEIGRHLESERDGRERGLGEYVRPTAEAFGYVFGLLPRGVGEADDDGHLFAVVGRHLGAALIAYDCACDWRDDRRAGTFNPVTTKAGEKDAARLCVEELTTLAEACETAFGPHARSAELARSVARSVGGQFGVPAGGVLCPAADADVLPGDTVLNFGCSMPVDHGSSGCCGCGRRAPTYVNMNQKETGCCCAAAGIGGLIILGLAMLKGAGDGGGCK